MSLIERPIQVAFRHRVYFTRGVFEQHNDLLREVLLDGPRRGPRKALAVVDESLSIANPKLVPRLETYFQQTPDIDLVCPAFVLEGGERVKNSYFHVSEIQSLIDRYHIDRHSYVVA